MSEEKPSRGKDERNAERAINNIKIRVSKVCYAQHLYHILMCKQLVIAIYGIDVAPKVLLTPESYK